MNPQRLLQHFDRIAEAPDAVARLRRFILDLAVRGKLVEQNLDDEPASELLKRIEGEKARLVKAGEIRKPRDLSDDHEVAQPFHVPASWRWCRLDAVGAIIGGGTPSAADSENFAPPGEGIPWLTPADLGGYTALYIGRGSRDLSEKGLKASSATMLPAGSVLFTSRAPIGYVAIAANPISTNQGFKSVVPYVGDCSRFIALGMQTFAPDIDARAPGTTFKEVSGKIVAGIPFPVPPLHEQHRIVAKVDELMALCDRLEAAQTKREQRRDRLVAASLSRINQPAPSAEGEAATAFRDHARFHLDHLPRLTTRPEHIKSLRQTILNLAVHGCLVPQHPNDEPAAEQLRRISEQRDKSSKRHKMRQMEKPHLWPDKEAQQLPTGWSWMNLGEVALSMRYGTSVKCNYDDSGVPVLRIPNVSSGKITLEDLKYGPLKSTDASELSLNVGDLLLIRSNGSIHIVGRAAVVTADAAEMSFAGYLVRLRLNNREISPNYVWTVLNSTEIRGQIEEPIRSAVGLKNVNLTEFGALSFRLPPLAEQHRIVAKVDKLMDICDQLEAQLTITQTDSRRLLDGLLHEALA